MNWSKEFEKWIYQLNLKPIMLKVLKPRHRNAVKYDNIIQSWKDNGGVLVMNPAMVLTLLENENDPLSTILLSGIHTLICDEAHDYLSNDIT
jgi:ATP-dependent helicase YprA (DUF1998 family)